jgi:hypothetical protein
LSPARDSAPRVSPPLPPAAGEPAHPGRDLSYRLRLCVVLGFPSAKIWALWEFLFGNLEESLTKSSKISWSHFVFLWSKAALENDLNLLSSQGWTTFDDFELSIWSFFCVLVEWSGRSICE